MPIKTLVLQVPRDLPVGTPVELAVVCDEAMRIEARANVAGQELWATVEPPKPPVFDPAGDIEGLVEQVESAERGMWGRRAESFRREADALVSGIREVVATDPDKLAVLCHRLRSLLDDFGPDDSAGGLAPPLPHFEWELDALRRVVYRAVGPLMGMDREAWDRRIGDIDARARHAYDAVDAVAWRRICDEVQALRETAYQDEFAAMRLDDPAYLARRVRAARFRAHEVEISLTDLVVAAADEVRELQLAERSRLLGELRTKVYEVLASIEVEGIDAAAARRGLEHIETDLERIEAALGRVGSIGIVAEHGGGPERP